MGSLWGAFELFGGELLSAMAVPHKSPFFFAFAIMTLIAAKRLLDFRGSSIVIALIVIFYKSFSTNFHVCAVTQISAIMLDGVAFEIGYQVFKKKFESSFVWRSFGGIIIAYAAYIILMSYDAIFDPKGFAACGCIPGMFQYISTSGTYAAILSLFTINFGSSMFSASFAITKQ